MVLTDTVHPPAGATALLAATDQPARELGWFLLPCVILSVVLMTACGCIVGNMQRQWPLYWWKPDTEHRLNARDEGQEGSGVEEGDVEKAELEVGRTETGTSSHTVVSAESCGNRGHVVVIPGKVIVSDGLVLSDEEVRVMEALGQRMAFD